MYYIVTYFFIITISVLFTWMRCNMSSLPTASFPCMLATYFTSGLPIMCSYGLEDTTITHKSRPKMYQFFSQIELFCIKRLNKYKSILRIAIAEI